MAAESHFSRAWERRSIFFLCGLAAVHVFIFSAAFPFFNNVDEQQNVDLVIKYSHGDVPRSLELFDPETRRDVMLYHSYAFLGKPVNAPGQLGTPPPWRQPPADIAARAALADDPWWQHFANYECVQPPLYYATAAGWWHLGRAFGLRELNLLYWLRFLNVAIIILLVWMSYAVTRLLFPDNHFLRLAVPALATFCPQTAFYSVQNDALCPLCFGLVFFLLVKLWRTEQPGIDLATLTGLALAAMFLAKLSTLPLLVISFAILGLRMRHLAEQHRLRAALPAFITLFLVALVPMFIWAIRSKIYFGDFTGADIKTRYFGWTYVPFPEQWHHPLFTLAGAWTFISGLMVTLWQGEYLWQHEPMTSPVVDAIYTVLSLSLIIIALISLARKPDTAETSSARRWLWWAFAGCVASVGFLAVVSTLYDYHDSFYPSREYPFFASGRLMLGALIPFLLLFAYGLDRLLDRVGSAMKFSALALFLLFMVGFEIVTDQPAFMNVYNWFHH